MRPSNPNNMSYQNGFTLIEVVIAIAVLTIGILALYQMQVTAIQGNATAQGLTGSSVQASDQVETLFNLPYGDVSLNDTNGNGIAGLDNIGATADYSVVDGQFTVNWNVALNTPVPNTKTIRVITVWTDHGQQKRTVLNHVKASFF